MSRYRKIDVRIWADAKFRQLSGPRPSGQVLWIYLLTGPHYTCLPGLFSIGEAAMAERLGWSLSDFRRCWSEIEGLDMARADWSARVVFLPNAVRYNEPANPNVVRGWLDAFTEVPECALKDEAAAAILAALVDRPSLHEAALEVFGATGPRPTPETVCETVPGTVSGTVSPTVCETRNRSRNRSRNTLLSEGGSVPLTAATEPPRPPVLTFPCKKTKSRPSPEWHLTEEYLEDLRTRFPRIDVLAELKKALNWCNDNPSRRKPSTDMRGFLTRWLNVALRDLERAPQPKSREEAIGEKLARIRADRKRWEGESAAQPGRVHAPPGKYDHLGHPRLVPAPESPPGPKPQEGPADA